MTEKTKSKVDGTETRFVIKCEHMFKGKICNSEILQIFSVPDAEYVSPVFVTYCERCKGVVVFSVVNNKLNFTFTDGNKYSNNSFFSPAVPPEWGGEREIGR